MNVRSVFETGATALLVVIASAMAAVFLRDRAATDTRVEGDLMRPPELIADWQLENERGIWIGPRSARVIITEFMDFQCPFCARLVARVDSLRAEYPGEVAIVVHHFPLEIHRFALQAAVAAECADRQGRYDEVAHLIFTKQDSLGLKPWRSYAQEAGVRELESFEACRSLPLDSFPRIGYGQSLGRRTGVRGTPTVWINGMKIHRSDLTSLRAWTDKITSESETGDS